MQSDVLFQDHFARRTRSFVKNYVSILSDESRFIMKRTVSHYSFANASYLEPVVTLTVLVNHSRRTLDFADFTLSPIDDDDGKSTDANAKSVLLTASHASVQNARKPVTSPSAESNVGVVVRSSYVAASMLIHVRAASDPALDRSTYVTEAAACGGRIAPARR